MRRSRFVIALASVCMACMIPHWGTRGSLAFAARGQPPRGEGEPPPGAARAGAGRKRSARRAASACSSSSAACSRWPPSPASSSPCSSARAATTRRRASRERRDRVGRSCRRSRPPTSTRPPRPPAARSPTRPTRARATSRRTSRRPTTRPTRRPPATTPPTGTRTASTTRATRRSLGMLVHTLEHGRIDVQYKPGTPEGDRRAARGAAGRADDGYHMLLFQNTTEHEGRRSRRTAWTHSLTCPDHERQGVRRAPDLPGPLHRQGPGEDPLSGFARRLPPAARLAPVEPVAGDDHAQRGREDAEVERAATRARRTRGRARCARARAATRGR